MLTPRGNMLRVLPAGSAKTFCRDPSALFSTLRHVCGPFALPAVDEGPRGIGGLHSCVEAEAGVDGAFLGPDATRDAAGDHSSGFQKRRAERRPACARNL